MTRPRTVRLGFGSRQGIGFFSLPPRPDRLWGPPNLLSNGYWGLLSQTENGRDVKLILHLHLMPTLKTRGAIPPLRQYVFMAWCLVKYTTVFSGRGT